MWSGPLPGGLGYQGPQYSASGHDVPGRGQADTWQDNFPPVNNPQTAWGGALGGAGRGHGDSGRLLVSDAVAILQKYAQAAAVVTNPTVCGGFPRNPPPSVSSVTDQYPLSSRSLHEQGAYGSLRGQDSLLSGGLPSQTSVLMNNALMMLQKQSLPPSNIFDQFGGGAHEGGITQGSSLSASRNTLGFCQPYRLSAQSEPGHSQGMMGGLEGLGGRMADGFRRGRMPIGGMGDFVDTDLSTMYGAAALGPRGGGMQSGRRSIQDDQVVQKGARGGGGSYNQWECDAMSGSVGMLPVSMQPAGGRVGGGWNVEEERDRVEVLELLDSYSGLSERVIFMKISEQIELMRAELKRTESKLSMLDEMSKRLEANPDARPPQEEEVESGKLVQPRYWDRDEHKRFVCAIQIFGTKDIKTVTFLVGTRTVAQVRSHLRKFFEKHEARIRDSLAGGDDSLRDSKKRKGSEGHSRSWT